MTPRDRESVVRGLAGWEGGGGWEGGELEAHTGDGRHHRPQTRTWYNLFKAADKDISGLISFAELESMLRGLLHMSHSELSDNDLRSLWRALDVDSSGHITSGEVRPISHQSSASELRSSVICHQHQS